MHLRILGWDCEGMRCPSASLKFNKNDRVDFIQMLNGTGKTTTLTLLKIALSGRKDIAELITDNPNITNKKEDNPKYLHDLLAHDCSKGTFKLYTEINKGLYTFEIQIDRNNNGENAALIFTTSPDSGGRDPGWHPPDEAIPFLSLNFVHLFIFNGENASELFIQNSTYAKNCIDTLCQFNILDESITHVRTYLDGKAQEIGKGAQSNITRLINRRDKFIAHLKIIEKDRNETALQIQKLKTEQKKIDTQINEKIKQKEEEEKNKKLIDNENKENDENLKNQVDLIFSQLINPMKIDERIKNSLLNFRDGLSQLRLPEDAAKEFFNELSEHDTCICDRQIGPKEKKAILDNSKNYLDSSTTGILNSIKSSIESFKDEENNFDKNIEDLLSLDRNAAKIQTRLARFMNEIGEDDEDFKKNYKRLGEIKSKLEEYLEPIITEYDGPLNTKDLNKEPDDDLININTIKRIIKNLDDEIHTASVGKQYKEAFDLFSEIVSNAKIKSSKIIYEGITEKAQLEIDKILKHAEPPIKIDKIDNYIKLKNRNGLSQGQLLAAAYIFMSSALSYSNISVPFVVDSPTGALDSINRSGIGKMIPSITEQFITFIHPEERPRFYSYIRNAAENKCSHHTIFWLTPIVKEWLDKQKIHADDILLKTNWGLIRGHELMDNFNLVDEAPNYKN